MTKEEAKARWICCPMCDKKKCEREADDCDVKKEVSESKRWQRIAESYVQGMHAGIAAAEMEVKMGNLVDYAKEELKRIGMIDSGEPYNDWATKAILDLIELFASQDHSGFTARYVIRTFSRLAMSKPLSPLTGEDDEWGVGHDGVFQNKRYSAVFKDKDGNAYNIEGKVFTDDGNIWYTSKDSEVNVTFPYVVPDEPEYIYRNKEVEE